MKPLLFALTVLLARAPQSQPAANAGSIEGFVVKLGTSEPVARARVILNLDGARGPSPTAATDGGGKFVFENVPPGRYRIFVTRDGYVRAEYGQRGPALPGNPIVVAARQEVRDVRIDLTPTGAISGRIYDRFGEPVGNANVQALKYTYQDGRRVLTVAQSGRTNDLGEYRLFWMQPGQYIVSAVPSQGSPAFDTSGLAPMIANFSVAGNLSGVVSSLPGNGLMSTPNPGETYLPVYFPGTTDAASAAPVDIRAGANYAGLDLTVVDARAVNIRGRVSGAGGSPNGTSVALIPRGLAGGVQNQRSASVANDGAFEFRGIAPGAYDLVATSGRQTIMFTEPNGLIGNVTTGRIATIGPTGTNFADRSPGSANAVPLAGRVFLDVGGADVENVSIPLQSGFNLSGRIAIDNRAPGAGDSVMTNMRVQLRPDPFIPQLSPQMATIDAGGAFTVSGIAPGDYRLTVSSMPRGGYVKSASLAGTDASNLAFRLDGEPRGQLAILIGTNPGSLDASVQDEKQQLVVGVTLVLVPDSARRQRSELYRTATSDISGRVHLDGVVPGDYKLFAWELVEPGAWQDPDFIRIYEDAGQTVHVGEGTRENAEVRIIPYR